jgi:hypothetical protein
MGKGYAEGPAAEEAERRREEGEAPAAAPAQERAAVFGATEDDPEPHFLGWRDEVDPERLFSDGTAWGLVVRRITDPAGIS